MTNETLPNGLETPDPYFRVVRDEETGERVGDLWCCTRYRGRRPQLFVCWIGVDEKHRRHGHATDSLRMLELEARRIGVYWLALATSGDNAAALALYTKLGFKPKNIFLALSVTS